MKLVSSILFAIMVLTVSSFYGQKSELAKSKTVFAAKLYATSTFESNNYTTAGGYSIIIPRSFSPAISWGKEYGNFNEVELTDFRFGTSKNSFTNGSFGIELGSRYSYNWRLFNKSETSRFSYFIGAGAGAKYAYSDVNYSYSDNSYSNRDFEISASIIPRVNMKIGKRMFLDVSLPYSFTSFYWDKQVSNNTNDPYANTKEQSVNAFPNNFTVNVGVAIKF